MEWNWLTIAVAGVFLLGFLIGIYRGAIRIAVSLATTILTIVIVVAASPYVSSAIEKHTPIDDMIKSRGDEHDRKTGSFPVGRRQ